MHSILHHGLLDASGTRLERTGDTAAARAAAAGPDSLPPGRRRHPGASVCCVRVCLFSLLHCRLCIWQGHLLFDRAPRRLLLLPARRRLGGVGGGPPPALPARMQHRRRALPGQPQQLRGGMGRWLWAGGGAGRTTPLPLRRQCRPSGAAARVSAAPPTPPATYPTDSRQVHPSRTHGCGGPALGVCLCR